VKCMMGFYHSTAGDILVEKPLGAKAKRNIDLWKG